MSIIFEHVKVGDLPEAWRKELAKPADAHVTVRIEEETAFEGAAQEANEAVDLLFGIWRDREDMADVEAYVRELRAPRYNRDGSRR